MSIPTATTAALQKALREWRDGLMRNSRNVTSLTPGELVSDLQDVCIGARIRPDELPPLLQALRQQALTRDASLGRKSEAISFLVVGVVNALDRSITA